MNSDNLLLNYGLRWAINVSQLFCYQQNEKLEALITILVDNILSTGDVYVVDQLLKLMGVKFKFEAVVHAPETLCYFAFDILQQKDLTCTGVGEYKIDALEHAVLTCLQNKPVNDSFNEL